jgi:hypothetical protein
MKRIVGVGAVLLSVAASVVALVGTPAHAAPAVVQATFTVQFPKGHPASNAPCPDDVFCGVGSVNGFGRATITILDETFDPIPDSDCLAVTRVEEIDLVSGAGSLVIESVGTFCRPGGSGGSSAGPSSYGSPGTWSLTFTTVPAESTGVFAGTARSGTESMVTAGGIGKWTLSSH